MKVKIRPTFCLYLATIALLSSWQTAISAVVALLIHECAHCLAARILNEPFERIELTPFGGVMTYPAGSPSSKGLRGLAIAASGPAGNALAIVCLGQIALHSWIDVKWLRLIIASNAVMLTLNLLPALPLDGGRMLFSVGYYAFGVSKLIHILSAAGILTGLSLVFIGLYGLICMGMLNLSLLFVGFYLIVCASRNRSVMTAENLYTVVQEKLSANHRIRRIEF